MVGGGQGRITAILSPPDPANVAYRPDFTDKEWIFGGSGGEVFTVIRDGTSADMDSYVERMSETDMWHLVNYIRSLSN